MEREFIQHCEKGNLQGVNKCLSHGVDVNARDYFSYSNAYQCTGLMIACNSGNSAIVSRLVQVPGLDINYQN